MKRVVILGAGGTGHDVASFLSDANRGGIHYECLGFLDDDPALQGAHVERLPVLGPLAHSRDLPEVVFLDALGSPKSYRRREERVASLQLPDSRFETLVHPTAVVAASASLGPGCIVYPLVVVGAGATLGRHVTLLSHSIVNHDCRVGDFSILASGVALSGRVRVGRSGYLGARATVIEDGEVGDGALVGMGSVVLRPVAAHTVVVGSPARKIRDLE